MKADGTDRRLLMHGFHFWHPAWSPDGRKIVFSSAPHLYVANADGSGKRRLVRSGFDPAWRPVPATMLDGKRPDSVTSAEPRLRLWFSPPASSPRASIRR